MSSILSRYLDPEALNRIAGRPFEPRGLVLGNLAGAHRSPLAGFAVEFAGHREYVAGDDPRHVDWRLFYTREKLFIKQYEMETNLVCHLVLDISASMRYGDADTQKLAYAARLATTLGYAIIKQNDKVSLATVDDAVRGFVPPGQSLAQIQKLTAHLDEVAAERPTRLPECLTELAGRTGRRGVVMVFSDLLCEPEELEPPLQQLRFLNHEVVLFQVLHPHERHFTFDGMVKFVDLEADGEELTQTEDVQAGYLKALAAHLAAVEAVCQRNKVELVAVDTGRPPGEVLVDYLTQRVRVRTR